MMEPLNASFHFYTGQFLLALGQYDEAQAQSRRAIELQPGAAGYGSQLAITLVKQGRFDQAIAAANADPDDASRLQAVVMIAHAQGDTAREKAALDEMIRRVGDDAPGMVAETFAFEGNLEQAFAWLDRAFKARDTTIMAIYEAPPEILGPLRKDPRFAAFCKKVGLPAPAEVVASPSVGQ